MDINGTLDGRAMGRDGFCFLSYLESDSATNFNPHISFTCIPVYSTPIHLDFGLLYTFDFAMSILEASKTSAR
jgi:hypothetical protein